MWVLKLHDDTPLGAPHNPEQAYTTFLDSNLNGIKICFFFSWGTHTHIGKMFTHFCVRNISIYITI